MRKRDFLKSMGAGLGAAAVLPGLSTSGSEDSIVVAASDCELKPGEIRHMVIFCLKHARDSKATSTFLRDGKRILGAIPGVKSFQVFSQVSKKNDFDFGFSMTFSGPADYGRYNSHPDHVNFVENRWRTEVSRFLEIDFEASKGLD